MADAQTMVYTDAGSGALKVRCWRVRVIGGPDAEGSLLLERGSLLIGSAAGNDLVLADPTVSRAHLELRLLDKGVQVRDLGSSNGTFHHGTRITESTLQGAAVIRVGATELAVEPADRELELDTGMERLGAMVGASRPMRELFGKVVRIAGVDVGVLIEGETGTGKELVAAEIHSHSRRSGQPFVVVDCGALPSGVVESELFGHLRGAFTGATADRVGAFEYAHGGTLFLDEIGELPQDLQPKLLRAIEHGQIKPVGGNRQREIDVRVLAATSRDLDAAVNAGTFRPDLFYRIAVVRLRLPALRDRPEDLPLLVRAVSSQVAGRELAVPDATLDQLAHHAWPGNVRELRNVISHALALRPGAEILELPEVMGLEAHHLGQPAPSTDVGDYREAKRHAVARFERTYLTNLLGRHAWNVSAAAREAGVDRNYLHRLMKRHDIRRP